MLGLTEKCPGCSACEYVGGYTRPTARAYALVVIIGAALVLWQLAACTLHVVVEQRPVAVVPMDAAVAVTSPASPGLVGDAGPCGAYSIRSLSANGCVSGLYYIDAAAQVIPVVRQANCENAGDVFEDCQK